MSFEETSVEKIPDKSYENINLEKVQQLSDFKTPLNKRLELAREFFPLERKQEMRESADRDKHGRPVSYFRLMSYKELESLLLQGEINPLNHPKAREKFEERKKEIKKRIQDRFEDLPERIKKEIVPDFEQLMENFTFESATFFLQNKLPLRGLLSFHFAAGEIFPGISGLISCSAGIPVLPPFESSNKEDGMVLVEMIIPSDDIIVCPVINPIREMAKEVDTKILKPEWVVDIYQGDDDFLKRFVLNPEYPMLTHYENYLKSRGRSKEYAGTGEVFDVLQQLKQDESLEDFIPIGKIADMNIKNPALGEPLY